MGDLPNAQPLGDANSSSGSRPNEQQPFDSTIYYDRDGRNPSYGGVNHRPSQIGYQSTKSYSPSPASQGRQDVFNMNSVGHALPDMSYSAYGAVQYAPGSSASLQQYQIQQQFSGQTTMTQQAQNLPYNMPYQAQYPGMYSQGLGQVVPNTGFGTGVGGNQYYQGQPFMGQPQQSTPPYFVQSVQSRGQPQQYHTGPLLVQSSPRGIFPTDTGRGHDYLANSPIRATPGRSGSIASSSAGPSSVVRGPPRKPRQSGHAIWIGNLPPHTDLMSLVHHVCKETVGLESLFLISKSNCAFANFKDEAACAAAQIKIHDSRFQTVRLVSRLRRSSTSSAKPIPTGPATLDPPVVASTPVVDDEPSQPESDGDVPAPKADELPPPKDKYFVVKSLTVEDLELSVRNGIWATQSHNEDTLNQAYQNTENVYLIFSANKSGEYFGYAKMISPINDDPAAAIEFAPKAHTVEDPELPKAIPTSATEFAPNGRIIDDSARGTIFWEAERDETEGENDETDENRSDDESGSGKKAWGKPFKIEWISTTRLPFYRTRGLRNPWNSNREVKIARDGTELETNVGQRLVGLFHRVPSPVAPTQPGMPIAGGYPSMRPF